MELEPKFVVTDIPNDVNELVLRSLLSGLSYEQMARISYGDIYTASFAVPIKTPDKIFAQALVYYDEETSRNSGLESPHSYVRMIPGLPFSVLQNFARTK